MLRYFSAAAGGRLILDSLQPTGVLPVSTKKDAPFLPQVARTCEPFPLDELAETGSGASEPLPDGVEGVPPELGATGALGEEEGVGSGVGIVPEGVLGEGSGVGVVPEGALGVVTGGVASGAPEGVPGVAGEVASGMVPDGVLGVAEGGVSGIVPDGGVAEGVLEGVTGEDVGEVGVASIGCA
jgi:hypothetical protein